MNRLSKWVGLARSMTLAALGFAFSTPVWAQCAMCKAVAGSQKAAAIVALNKGIVLLAVPPAAIILGIGWLTYKHRNSPQPQGSPVSKEKTF